MLETGAGVSTISMFLAAIKNKKFYTFDQLRKNYQLLSKLYMRQL